MGIESKKPVFESVEMQTIGQAFNEVNGIYGQVIGMGANDIEHQQFREIIQALQNGNIEAEQAVSKAMAIMDAKMNYH